MRLDELRVDVIGLVERLAPNVVTGLAEYLAELHCLTTPRWNPVQILPFSAEVQAIGSPHSAQDARFVAVLTAVRDAAAPPAHAGLILADAIEVCLTGKHWLTHLASMSTVACRTIVSRAFGS